MSTKRVGGRFNGQYTPDRSLTCEAASTAALARAATCQAREIGWYEEAEEPAALFSSHCQMVALVLSMFYHILGAADRVENS